MRSGEVSAAPSSLNTFGGFEQEKAKTTPGKGAIGPDQRMYPTTAAQDMGLVPMPWERAAAVRGGGPTNASERGMAASVAEPNPDPVQAAQRERASILRELPNVQDPKSQAAMRYQIADLDKVIASGGAGAQTATPSALVPSGGKAGGMDFSPAEKADQAAAEAAKVAQAKGEVVLKQDKQKALDSGNDALRTIDKALNHPGLETGTGLSSKVNPKNYIPGTDAFNFGVVRDQLKGQAFLQAFASLKGGGQITEVEGTKAENAMARLNNAQSTKEYKDSLQDLRDVVDRGLRRTRGENVPDVPLASNDGSKAPGKVIDDLPKTAAVGARLRDTTTGKILKFDGLKWKDE
jgi:hypothetical protein